MTYYQFIHQKEIKHKADLDVDHVILLDDGEVFKREDKNFIRVICDGRTGKEHFFGFVEETGKRVGWFDSDLFKIIGVVI